MESLLGLRREGQQLSIQPCLPPEWTSYDIHYRYIDTDYQISVTVQAAPDVTSSLRIDGALSENLFIMLENDQQNHIVEFMYSKPVVMQ